MHLIVCQLYLNKSVKNLIGNINISLDFTNLGTAVCWNCLIQLVRVDGYILSKPVVKCKHHSNEFIYPYYDVILY